MQLILKGILKIVAPLVVVAVLVLFLLNFNAISDWWKLLEYQPSADVSALAEKTTMTEHAKRLFYVNHPEILGDPKKFQEECPQVEQTIVLGCYHNDQSGIFVYEIKEEKLNGIKEVTAAHEMLHAHYDRLNDRDKKYVEGLIQEFFQSGLNDKRIISNIELYKKTEPDALLNEMHSIFATEIASLPQPLEDYYKRYFKDRSAVVKMALTYESEFTSRTNQINQYDTQLKALKSKIDQERAQVEIMVEQLKNDKARLDDLKSSDRIEEYNAAVPAYNSLVDKYNQTANELKSDIDRYNMLVEEYNKTAKELRGLYEAINANSIPQPQQ